VISDMQNRLTIILKCILVLPVACIGYILPIWFSLVIAFNVDIGSIALLILDPIVLFIAGCCYMISGAWVAPHKFKHIVEIALIVVFVALSILHFVYSIYNLLSSSNNLSDELFLIPSAIGVFTIYIIGLKTNKNAIQSHGDYNNSIGIKQI